MQNNEIHLSAPMDKCVYGERKEKNKQTILAWNIRNKLQGKPALNEPICGITYWFKTDQ